MICAIIAGKIYKDEIRNYIITEINKEIKVKINVSAADFSFFRKFPFVSIVLSEVSILSGKDFNPTQFSGISTDSLFTASRIYLQFNILDILQKDYRLRRVYAENGRIIILVDKIGGVNYRIFKESSNNEKTSFSLGLDGVKVSGFKWEFLNLAKDIHAKGIIEDLVLKGKFSQENFSLNTKSVIFIETFNREGIDYASKMRTAAHIILDVRDSLYTINNGELILNDLAVKTSGSFTIRSNINLNLQIEAEKLNIGSLITTLPINLHNISKYSPKGSIELLAKIKGEISSTNVPSIRIAFRVSNGAIKFLESQKTIRDISVRGTYSNGSKRNALTSRLNISEYSLSNDSSELNGSISFSNFLNPFISGTVFGKVTAKAVSDILNIEGWDLQKGLIYPDLTINMNLASFESFDIHTISPKGLNGKIVFKDIAGIIPYSKVPIDLFEGSVKIDGDIFGPRFKLKMGKNSFSGNLIINNLWESINSKNALPVISGEIQAGYFRIKDFLSDASSSEEIDFHLPDSVILNLHCVIDSFEYGKFLASELETWFTYKPKILSVSTFKMKAMKGFASGNVVIIEDIKNQMLLKTSLDLKKIDINKLFFAFNNFAQDFIISDNLKGYVSGTLDFSTNISPKLELVTKDLFAQSDFIIEDGELINFKPITELSSFVELSELQHIKFSTLKNSILIKDEKVFIPQMDINSTAFNITISGTHKFDNYFEYRMRLSLSEILARKAKKAKKENEEFGVIENDGVGNTNLYLSIIGTPENYKIKYDKKEAINKIKTDIKEERKLIKTILKEELGLFKKDTLNSEKSLNQLNNSRIILDWSDETTEPQNPEQKTKKASKTEPALKVIWDEEDPKTM